MRNTFTRLAVSAMLWLILADLLPPASAFSISTRTFRSSERDYLNPNTGRFWSMDSYEGNQDNAQSLHKYLYCHGNPVNHVDPSGNSVYVCTRPLNISGLSILAPAFNHFFLAFDTDNITSSADWDKWVKVVADGDKNVTGQYSGINYGSFPHLSTFSFHPYSVYSGKGEKDEVSVYSTSGSYVAYNDNIDHDSFLQAKGGGIRNGRHLVTSDLNEQIRLYTEALKSRDRNNSGSPDAHPYAALD
jgi:RHS repeat-associated protein